MIDLNSTNLRTMLLSYLDSDDIALYLFNILEDSNELILFGGIVRDYIIYNCIEPRDIDIVLVGSHDFLSKLEWDINIKDRISKNSFGGYKINTPKFTFDIWNINDTWAFKEGFVKQGIENLLKTVFLNIDAYAYNITKDIFIDKCNIKEFPTIIDIVLPQNSNLPLNFIRAIILSRKYQIKLSNELKRRIIHEVNNSSSKKEFISTLIKEQERHYNKIIITFNELDVYLEEFKNN